MTVQTQLLMGVCALVVAAAIPAVAAETTQSVTTKESTVNPDGSVSYESHTVVTKDPAPVAIGTTTTTTIVPATSTTTVITPAAGLVTFYYFDPKMNRIMAANDLTENVFAIWDTDRNRVIDNHEFYTNQLVAYEPVEYSKRTYQDIDLDGVPELTKEEYTIRLQKVPTYVTLNTDKKEGLTLYEFTGVGFQDADNDNDNQVGYDELKAAFYHEAGLAPKPDKTNKN